ncbi:putative serine threonine protein kinase [Phaeomoniella chlamydospora]|uniref:Putative serine threonine protein kinase n=1 Tax=Phaeomoniella chlamydospora TaxID=158046 RepID=A0A0G2HH12_PHACM|nr:putative serine threonine protein kinase [Phaeomoniella chlamydospora]
MAEMLRQMEIAQTQSDHRYGEDVAAPAADVPRERIRANHNVHPPALEREMSEVINRVAVSDPAVDLQRERERMAEAQPASAGKEASPVGGLGLVGSEGVDDGGRGPQRRQDYSNANARRKDVKFGEYMLGQTLGEGEFGKVKLGWKRDGSVQVAIKLIRRESVATNPSRLPKIYREISILRELSHPNIVRLHEMVETDRHIGIILEYASGGELFDYILNHRYLKDPAARRLFAQLVSGVGYLHKKGIVHRDLKLENLLLDRNRNIIITDFGFANTFDPNDQLSEDVEYNLANKDFVRKFRLDRLDDRGYRRGDLMQTSCGSPCYAAPELVYAMLAGYLPFDDDPANPEGDNINLLYKYITTTPLTFPEYVTPHARDLLRRILVPDPRKRADLFEVARHSWLSEYHHVVSHITSSTTNIADIANSTVPAEEPQEAPQLMRSSSVREPSKTHASATPVGGLSHSQGKIMQDEQDESAKPARDTKRRTVQVEYVAPQSQTTRGETAPIPTTSRADNQAHLEASRSKPLPSEPPVTQSTRNIAQYPPVSMPPPTRPGRDVPRSVSDSSAAFGIPSIQPGVTRPSTGGSMTSAASGARLPSRGSYGQPVAPTVTSTPAQGRLAQPTSKAGRSYQIPNSSSLHRSQQSQSIQRSETQQLSGQFHETQAVPPPKSHHRRSSTLSNLGEKLFGRSNSQKKQQNEVSRPKRDKKYPPTSMKDPYATDNPRSSIDSKRSVSFGFGKKKSVDLESQEEKPRRYSFIPSSFSFRGLSSAGSQSDDQNYDFSQPAQTRSRPSTTGQARMPSYNTEESMPLGTDGQNERTQYPSNYNFSSRQPQTYAPASQPAQRSDDVYGGTGVYGGERSYLQTTPPPAEPNNRGPQQAVYSDGFNSYDELPGRASMQQGRSKPGVLQKPRKFGDAYDYEVGPGHHDGSSGAARKVMDFFRRRGKARTNGEN